MNPQQQLCPNVHCHASGRMGNVQIAHSVLNAAVSDNLLNLGGYINQSCSNARRNRESFKHNKLHTAS